MKTIKKALIISLLFFVIRILSSCCNCDDTSFRFNYIEIVVNNIDNSGQWSRPSKENVMQSVSIAFEVQIVGCDISTATAANGSVFSFKTLSAQSCNCEDFYMPRHDIVSIRIYTLDRLNDMHGAGTELSASFLANTCINCDDVGSFYITIDELIGRINNVPLYNKPINKFLVYYTEKVESETAKFEFEVTLSDGTILIAQSETISII